MDRRRHARPGRPHGRRHRRQQRPRPRRRRASSPAPARAWCSPCATPARASAAAADDRRRRRGPPARPRRPRLGARVRRAPGRATSTCSINNAGVMAPPRAAHRRRLRAAVRHQPPRPLRADQPAAAARHRPGGHGLLDGAHRIGHDRPRRPQLGAPRATSAGAPTGSPSWPTCCSRSSCSAGSTPPARTSAPSPPTPATPRPTCSRAPQNVLQNTGHGDRQPRHRPERRDGRAADAVRGDAGPARRRATSARTASRRSAATRRSSAAAARRQRRARPRARLWERSEELTGVQLPAQPVNHPGAPSRRGSSRTGWRSSPQKARAGPSSSNTSPTAW